MTRTCAWVDDDDTACPNPADRKWCDHHKAAAAALRSKRHRDTSKVAAEAEAPVYVPRASRDMQVSDGRTMPRPHDVPAKAARSYAEPELVDYSRGGMRRPSIYERPRSTVPAEVRRDAVRHAQYLASEQASSQPVSDHSHWQELAELGEEAWLQQQIRLQQAQETEPYVHAAEFSAPWRRGWADPSEADMVDGNAMGFRR